MSYTKFCHCFTTVATALLYSWLQCCAASRPVVLNGNVSSGSPKPFAETKLSTLVLVKYSHSAPSFVFQDYSSVEPSQKDSPTSNQNRKLAGVSLDDSLTDGSQSLNKVSSHAFQNDSDTSYHSDDPTNSYQNDSNSNSYQNDSNTNGYHTKSYQNDSVTNGYHIYSHQNNAVTNSYHKDVIHQNDSDTNSYFSDADTHSYQNDFDAKSSQNDDANTMPLSVSDGVTFAEVSPDNSAEVSQDAASHFTSTVILQDANVTFDKSFVMPSSVRRHVNTSLNQSILPVVNNFPGFSDRVTFSTSRLTECLQTNKTLNFKVINFTLSYFQYENISETWENGSSVHEDFVCWFNLTTPNHTVVKIRFTEQTCSRENYISLWFQVVATVSDYLDSRNGCEDWWSPLLVDYISATNAASFGIVIRNFTSPYTIRLHVTAVSSEEKTKAHIYYLQDFGKTLLSGTGIGYFYNFNDQISATPLL